MDKRHFDDAAIQNMRRGLASENEKFRKGDLKADSLASHFTGKSAPGLMEVDAEHLSKRKGALDNAVAQGKLSEDDPNYIAYQQADAAMSALNAPAQGSSPTRQMTAGMSS